MKKNISLSILLLCFTFSASAQLGGLIDKAKQAVENRAKP
jgi:hypothetical protein